MSKPFTGGGRLRRPLHWGAQAVRPEVRCMLADRPTLMPPERARALGMAEAVPLFAPASGGRPFEEVVQVL